MERQVLKPLAGKTLTFWHVGGDLIWRSKPIDRELAEGLRDIYRDETRAGWKAKDFAASRFAASLWTELTHAMDAQDTWNRVVGRAA